MKHPKGKRLTSANWRFPKEKIGITNPQRAQLQQRENLSKNKVQFHTFLRKVYT